ncbi:hypothetical protein ACJIZ3_013720 [Penstemon smallii]|uniref:RNA-dependent RNA polymerase n=1 Tax=Penstemon smallii TaxID=265156 RepID=A0ABD3RJF2_9LAMI
MVPNWFSSIINLIHSKKIDVNRVQVTPIKVYFFSPDVNISNYVLRHFENDIDNIFCNVDVGFNSIRNVAKYAERLYQSFGSSTKTLSVSKHDIEYILDVELISDCFARSVTDKYEFKDFLLSAFQIRSSSSSMMLSLRPNMLKYDSKNSKLDKEILKCGYKPNEEPFILMMLQTFRQMMGCLDETKTLEYKQGYLVKGELVVANNPCLYPGDIRALKVVDVEALHYMVYCVDFQRNGSYSDLIPPIKETKPLNYNLAPSVQLDHDVTIESWITMPISSQKTIYDSFLPRTPSLLIKEPEMTFSNSCVDLANKLRMSHTHMVKDYPNFMEKTNDITYQLHNAIKKLYREVKSTNQTKPLNYNLAPSVQPDHDVTIEVMVYFDSYNTEVLLKLCIFIFHFIKILYDHI